MCIKPFFFKKIADRVGRFGTLVHPVFDPLRLKGHLRRVDQRIVCADFFQISAVPGALAVSDNDSVERFFLGAMSGQSDFYSHSLFFSFKTAAFPGAFRAYRLYSFF